MAGEGEFHIRIESASFIACMKVDFSAKLTNAEILIDGNGISGNNFGLDRLLPIITAFVVYILAHTHAHKCTLH